MISNCTFCNIDITKIENTIIEETKYFYVTPSIGSIVNGYLLIISKRHINSMSELNKEELQEYEQLIEKYRRLFKSIYQKYPIIFEHGTPNLEDNIKASSVTHAHTHIVNHNYKNEDLVLNKLNFKKIKSLGELNSDKNYIFYINQSNDIYVTNNFKPISQMMRIIIADDLDIRNKYDWRQNSFENNVVLTINNIKEYYNN